MWPFSKKYKSGINAFELTKGKGIGRELRFLVDDLNKLNVRHASLDENCRKPENCRTVFTTTFFDYVELKGDNCRSSKKVTEVIPLLSKVLEQSPNDPRLADRIKEFKSHIKSVIDKLKAEEKRKKDLAENNIKALEKIAGTV